MFGVVLGVDPGLSRCGYGVVRRDGDGLGALAAGVVRTAPDDPLSERLACLDHELSAIVAELEPDALAVERLLFQHNVRTAMAVGQASGVILAVAGRAGMSVTQYSPNEVKQAVVGHGGADKRQVQVMVARLLGLREVPGPPDAADALALAVCHAWRVLPRSDGATAPGLARAVEAALAREDTP